MLTRFLSRAVDCSAIRHLLLAAEYTFLHALGSGRARSRGHICPRPLNLELVYAFSLELLSVAERPPLVPGIVSLAHVDCLLTRIEVVSVETWSALRPFNRRGDLALPALKVATD